MQMDYGVAAHVYRFTSEDTEDASGRTAQFAEAPRVVSIIIVRMQHCSAPLVQRFASQAPLERPGSAPSCSRASVDLLW